MAYGSAPAGPNRPTNHSRLLADDGEVDMLSHRPGVTNGRACQRGLVRTCVEMTWLMLNVPATIDSMPGCAAPMAVAAASTSWTPQVTGVPSASPVRAAASAVTAPATASPGTIGGSFSSIPARPNRASAPGL